MKKQRESNTSKSGQSGKSRQAAQSDKSGESSAASASVTSRTPARSRGNSRIHRSPATSSPGSSSAVAAEPLTRTEPPTRLGLRIALFTPALPSLEPEPAPTSKRLPTRLQHAIDRLRWHICGLFGVKAPEVSDAHVAQFLARLDDNYLARVLPGIGILTEEDLRAWGRKRRSEENAAGSRVG